MNLYREIESLLLKAKDTDEYFNPSNLSTLRDMIKEFSDEGVLDELFEWIQNMWSR